MLGGGGGDDWRMGGGGRSNGFQGPEGGSVGASTVSKGKTIASLMLVG